jgi:hypothetical protein
VDAVPVRRAHLLEGAGEPAVELDREDPASRLGEGNRQRAEAGTDLQDRVVRTDARIGDDRAGEVGIDEEVLAERPGRGDPVTLG